MTIIGTATVFLIIAGILAFMPVTVVKANVQPYKVSTPIVKSGDNLIYIADVCKYREALSVVTRSFIDEHGTVYPLPEQKSNIRTGCFKTPVTVAVLPGLHTGKWYLTLDVEYTINILRKETYHYRTDTFTITDKN